VEINRLLTGQAHQNMKTFRVSLKINETLDYDEEDVETKEGAISSFKEWLIGHINNDDVDIKVEELSTI
jgi:hypothetical protein